MKDLSVKDIVRETKGKIIIGNENYICKRYSRDTRKVQEGDCFIGIKGENFDGNMFWKEALEKGANCVIVQDIEFNDEEIKNFRNKTIIKVKDTLEALQKIAEYKRSLYNIPVIGITGSVGKTSTKDMVANVIKQKYKTLKTRKNNNGQIGLPFTILSMQDEEVLVVEMGMNHFGEMRKLTNIAKPNICVFTNIGTSHIGNLGSRENILKAKMEILEGIENPTIILNNDNDLLHKWNIENKNKMNIKTFGIDQKSDLNAENINLEENYSTFYCNINGKDEKINVPVGGEHFILNSLCAITVGLLLNIEIDKIKNGIENFELTEKRMDITEIKNGVKIINDAYNASLESMKASLKVLSQFKNGRKIAVLGDMFELGEYSKELHEKVGEEVIKNNIDILICSGQNSQYIVEKAKEQIKPENIYYKEDKEDILEILKNIVKKDDVILFKASNGMKFYEIAEKVITECK